MDLSKKADTERGCHIIKEEYIEEDVDVNEFKDQVSGPSKSPGGLMTLTMPTLPPMPYASPLYPPFPGPCPPFYCPPISAFSLVSLPAPPYTTAFRDLMENNQNGAADHSKRKPSSKINETNKKLREGSEPSQGQLVPASPIREKDKTPEESSGWS